MRYDENETMKLLGKQYACTDLCSDGVAYEAMNELLEAYGKTGELVKEGFLEFFSLTLDVYTLGYINGKRAERAKRKKTIKKPATNEI